jgi:hypothetical protein
MPGQQGDESGPSSFITKLVEENRNDLARYYIQAARLIYYQLGLSSYG